MKKHISETTGHQRLVSGALVGLLVAMVPLPMAVSSRGLLAWAAGCATYLVLAWILAVEFDAVRTREHAQSQDQPSLLLFVLVFLSVFASGAVIAYMLQHTNYLTSLQRVGHVILSIGALGASWLLMQTIFAFRYAHVYYQAECGATRMVRGWISLENWRRTILIFCTTPMWWA